MKRSANELNLLELLVTTAEQMLLLWAELSAAQVEIKFLHTEELQCYTRRVRAYVCMYACLDIYLYMYAYVESHR